MGEDIPPEGWREKRQRHCRRLKQRRELADRYENLLTKDNEKNGTGNCQDGLESKKEKGQGGQRRYFE